jgi:hypothetical protein
LFRLWYCYCGIGSQGDARKPETEEYYITNGLKDWGKYLTEIKLSEIVLLRKGQTIIKAVGVVSKEYDYSISLSDIHGWDLNHYISVDWYIKEDESDIMLPSALIGYSTMSEVKSNYETIKDLINGQKLKKYDQTLSLKDLKIPKQISEKDIRQFLIDSGIRISDATNITDTISRIITLVEWYIENYPEVLEYELRTFLVIPFLFSLGWSEQKIKIEYSKIDVALFSKPYKKNYGQQPFTIIETKSFNDGLLFARNQAKDYSEKYPECKNIITTNGYRYCIYKKVENDFNFYSYINLLDMREFDYIDNKIKGALESLIKISTF